MDLLAWITLIAGIVTIVAGIVEVVDYLQRRVKNPIRIGVVIGALALLVVLMGVMALRGRPSGPTAVLPTKTPVLPAVKPITWRSLAELHGHTGYVFSALFSPDGKWVVTASLDGTARVWEASTGKTIAELRGHAAPLLFGAAFSPDGKWVATASADNTARVWEVSTK
jgi:hypothetical protein